MKRCILVSGGQDSKILHHMLLKDYPDIVSVNIPKPSEKGLIDYVDDADVTIDWIANPSRGDNVYWGTLYTIEQKVIPFYDEIWVGSNKSPDGEWFKNHSLAPKRGELLPKYPNVFQRPYEEKYKWEVMQIGIDNSVDLTGTHSCTIQPKSEGHCRECWFCKEREWSYNQLKLDVYWE